MNRPPSSIAGIIPFIRSLSDPAPEPSGPLADYSIVRFMGGGTPGLYEDHPPTAVLMKDKISSQALWLVGAEFADVIRQMKRLIGGVEELKMEPGGISPMPQQIQIGCFGQLHHDAQNYELVDTFMDTSSGGTGVRRISLPDEDFELYSGKDLVYSWNESSETGAWHGSEKTRRELERAEMQMRALEDVAPRGGQPGQMHRRCSHDDHPKGCRARATQAGFGCVVGEGRG